MPNQESNVNTKVNSNDKQYLAEDEQKDINRDNKQDKKSASHSGSSNDIPAPSTETSRIKIKIPREEIVFMDMIFKSYGGLALVTVDHLDEGTLFLDVTEGTRPDVMAILKDLQKSIPLTIYENYKHEEEE
ncbi:MAG: DUF4911 domain-containing protein [Halanaerobiales bacterium]